MEPLISIAEVARILGKSIPATRMHQWRGNLPPALKVGKCVFWRREQFENFIYKPENGKRRK